MICTSVAKNTILAQKYTLEYRYPSTQYRLKWPEYAIDGVRVIPDVLPHMTYLQRDFSGKSQITEEDLLNFPGYQGHLEYRLARFWEYLTGSERNKNILDYVGDKGTIKVTDDKETLDKSPATIKSSGWCIGGEILWESEPSMLLLRKFIGKWPRNSLSGKLEKWIFLIG